jgi:hypothetical protein
MVNTARHLTESANINGSQPCHEYACQERYLELSGLISNYFAGTAYNRSNHNRARCTTSG